MRQRGTADSRTILLVEDEVIIALSQKKKLESHGFSVLTAHNARDAITMAREKPVDLVLMDIDLGPGQIDGTEAAQSILSYMNIPIVFCTSHTEKEMVDKVKGITRYGYVIKRSGEFVLIEAINMAFELFEANNRVHANEEKYHTLFQFVPQAVLMVDGESGKVLEANSMAERLYGYSQKELLNSSLRELSADQDASDDNHQPAGSLLDFMPVSYHRKKDGTVIPVEIRMSEHRELQGRTVNIITIRGLTDKRRLEYALRKAEIEKEAILDSINFNLIYVNRDFKILWANKAAAVSAEERVEDLLGRTCYHFWGENGSICGHCPVNQVFRTGESHEAEFTTEEGRTWRISGNPVFTTEGNLVGAIDMAEDITEQTRAINIMQENLFDLQTAQKIALLGSWELDIEHNRLEWSEETFNIFECGPADFGDDEKSFWSFIHPDDLEMVREAYSKSLETKQPYEIEHRIVTKKGTVKYVREKCNTEFDSEGKPLRSKGIVLDISKTKRVEEVLKRALREKDFLMRELNHRVKNNLIMISSLIDLKEASIEENNALSDIRRQIDAIRIVHEKLYQSDDVVHIDLREYIDDLLATIFSFNPGPVAIRTEVETKPVPVNTAVTLGLIINEIASNAIKHGLSGLENAEFSLELKADVTSRVHTMKISNNGPPIPGSVSLSSHETLGLRLISTLIEQLHGTIDVLRNPHPIFIITFPMEK